MDEATVVEDKDWKFCKDEDNALNFYAMSTFSAKLNIFRRSRKSIFRRGKSGILFGAEANIMCEKMTWVMLVMRVEVT